MATQTISGTRAIVASLETLGVSDVFGMPGGAILLTYDPLMSSKLHHILVRHEQGATHTVEGYVLASGKVGCAIITSGPGMTNTLTTIADANMGSIPIVAISNQVGASFIGTDVFQEANVVGAVIPLAKHSFFVTDPRDIPSRIAEAFIITSPGHLGPVLMDVACSAQTESLGFSWPPAIDLLGFKLPAKPHREQVRTATEMILSAKAPVFYVGGSVIRANVFRGLAYLVDAMNAPVAITLTARGAFPDSDRRNLGIPGIRGIVPAADALQEADLVIALGARFDNCVTSQLDSFVIGARVVYVDISAVEISKSRYADIPIVGDLAEAAPALITEVIASKRKRKPADISQWRAYPEHLKEEYPLGWGAPEDGMMAPQEVLKKFSKIVGLEAIYMMGVRQHQIQAARFISYEESRHLLSSCGLDTMGYCIPAAMGAKVAQPDTVVWAIDGDGSLQMANQELATYSINKIPIRVYLINGSVLDMVCQWQNLFYGQHYSYTTFDPDEGEQIPNFGMFATVYGMAAKTVCSIGEVSEATEWATFINDRPVLVDFHVSGGSMVWPTVAAGVSDDEIRYAWDMAPDWDLED